MDEVCLVEKLSAGETDCFESLILKYHKRIYDFIYKMVHNRQTSEDLTQEVFIKVYKSIRSLKSSYSLKPWIFKIAYTTTLNHLKRNRHITVDIDTEEIVSDKDYIGNSETRHVILEEIQSLKPDCRAIFLLHIMEDLSFEQIGIMLGISSASAKLKFYRNRKKLIDKLSKSFGEV